MSATVCEHSGTRVHVEGPDGKCVYCHHSVTDRTDLTVWRLTAADLDAIAGRELSTEELARVARALDNESMTAIVQEVVDAACEDAPRVPVYFDPLGNLDGQEYGNAVTRDGGDPVEYDLTRAQYDAKYPDNLY